ncbi:MAG: hypothetical protein ABL932_12040 [Terricaulis sp.]
MRPQIGQRYIVRDPFETIVTTQWLSPFTGGASKVIPAGVTFCVDYDPPNGASAIGVKPNDPERWLSILVDEPDRNDPKFGGYHISIDFDVLASHCERLT